ncbi:MAG TPA: hypothetical protein PKC49_04890 [Phycisphaerae bacterium]|nr:hypothetical protein [Phycisphaerae bacterium]
MSTISYRTRIVHANRNSEPPPGSMRPAGPRRRGRVGAGTIALAAALLAGAPAAADSVELRVSRVAVFSSGVAYFECDATIDGSATAQLDFRTEQINDIIKSLVVFDPGGSVGVVGYASQDPLEKTLRSFGVDLTGKPTLGQLLDQLRGEPVRITGSTSAEGVILGVERQRVPVKDTSVEMDVLNLLTDSGVQQLRVSELGGIKLANAKVADELKKALAALAASHDADKKSVRLSFHGQGQRGVRVAYLLEAPIWKTTYRLALDEKEKPFLQGWATVENATEEDWDNIRLSLISGRPISFVMDLYTPIYIPRPRVELELYASLRPPEYEGALGEDKMIRGVRGGGGSGRALLGDATRERMAAKAPMTAAPAAGLPVDAQNWAAEEPMSLADSGVESVAAATEAGELFEYAIRMPVSIARRQAAMLPIVNNAIEGEKVSIYNPATHAKYPLNGLQITNTTGLNLMQGPVTVFDGNVYAGDARLPDLQPGEKRLVGYALDLACEVTVRGTPHERDLLSLRIAKGTLWLTHKQVDERRYVVKNKAEKPKNVLIEQSYGDDWKLMEPAKPHERTANLSRFKVNAPAGQTVEQPVRLERTVDEAVALGNMGADQVRFYIRSRVISPAVKEALERVIALRAELDTASRQRADGEQQLAQAVQEQARVRQNLQTLEKNTDVYKRQLKKFDDLETQIEQLAARKDELRKAEEGRRSALEQYLLSLDVK